MNAIQRFHAAHPAVQAFWRAARDLVLWHQRQAERRAERHPRGGALHRQIHRAGAGVQCGLQVQQFRRTA